ncbi:YjjG family noncanonical pyrimidine nucleotidase [Aureivirga sp. CE67]|uniref:YjjG family noncanonical pyrimidine nucleotidase n=1 Tax=Aureivirga sp. CE67 TaxID=1788983 RepID=UPI0018C91F8C|nr:YjjG family noncanonical pyrimidine nucleotidase [Aureivirga sp. CE67]
MNNIKHIFFDLDHTLWDFETNSDLALEAILKENTSIDVEEFLKFYRPINHEYWQKYAKHEVTKEALKYGRLKDTFDALNYEIQDDKILFLGEEYLEKLAEFDQLFENTHEVLNYLKEKYTLHIITNGFKVVQNKKIKNSKLESYFDVIVTSECVGVNKPNPEIFKFALEKAGAEVENSMMIGDNLQTDILGAKNVGMQTIFCNFNRDTTEKGITQIHELKDLFSIL